MKPPVHHPVCLEVLPDCTAALLIATLGFEHGELSFSVISVWVGLSPEISIGEHLG
jgi:hypothetical protein